MLAFKGKYGHGALAHSLFIDGPRKNDTGLTTFTRWRDEI